MKKVYLLLLFLFIFQNSGCKENESPSASTSKTRVGAICNDGTKTDATGSGACSHHGGVKEWIYK